MKRTGFSVTSILPNGFKNSIPFSWTKRTVFYSVILVLLMVFLSGLIITRKDFDALVSRICYACLEIIRLFILSWDCTFNVSRTLCAINVIYYMIPWQKQKCLILLSLSDYNIKPAWIVIKSQLIRNRQIFGFID